jgi:hypothetical protein
MNGASFGGMLGFCNGLSLKCLALCLAHVDAC